MKPLVIAPALSPDRLDLRFDMCVCVFVACFDVTQHKQEMLVSCHVEMIGRETDPSQADESC